MRKLNKKISVILATLMVAFLLPIFSSINVQAYSSSMLDVYEGDNISDFNALKQSDMPILIKSTEGMGYKDRYYLFRANMCTSLQIPFGFYHMLTKNSNVEGQAEDFYNATKHYNNTIMNALDVEYENIPDAEGYVNRFINRYKELSGQDLLIYSYRNYLNERFSNSFLNSHYLWVADYSRTMPNFPNMVAWQYSESVKLGWVGNKYGNVDVSNILMPDTLFRNGGTIDSVYVPVASQKSSVAYGKVAEIQEIMNRVYGKNLVIDNIYGSKTAQAFKECIGTINNNSNPEVIAWLQRRLGFIGRDVDSIIGNNTKSRIGYFQKHYGLSKDYIVGKNTFKVICTC